jgi:hypothetical protein
MRTISICHILVSFALCCTTFANESVVRVAVFSTDVSPPVGSPVAYAPTRKLVDPLSARGIVIFGDEKPVVICAVDFIAISNEGHDAWRSALAEAAGTDPSHVTVHALHQHDGPRCDFMAEGILAEHGLGGKRHDVEFLRDAIARTAHAARSAVAVAQPVTHIGAGEAPVEKVASNRRILGADGKVKLVRFSRSTDPEAIAAPVGTIDPFVKSISFWNDAKPLAVLTYYATHPQSHYGEGDVTCEFVGLARNARESALGVPHIHFTGAAGNIAAGKYNDGSPEMRPVLTARLEAGMKSAWDSTEKIPISTSDLAWRSQPVLLPMAHHLDEAALRATLADPTVDEKLKYPAASKLAWLERNKTGHAIDVSALRLGKVWLLHLPAESFVEYQLAAQGMRNIDDFICTAAYGNGGPGYIGTEIAYHQGGYETGESASLVAPEVEKVLLNAIASVLD